MNVSAKTGGFLGYVSLFTSLGTATVLCAAVAVCSGWTRSNGCICRFNGTLADQPFATQGLGLCGCRRASRCQFRLRVSHCAQVAAGGTKLSGRSAERLRHCKPDEPGDFVGLSGNLPGWMFLGISI